MSLEVLEPEIGDQGRGISPEKLEELREKMIRETEEALRSITPEQMEEFYKMLRQWRESHPV